MPILQIEKLNIIHEDQVLVKELSFKLEAGKCLAVVGESGSGKSLSSLAIMGLLPKNLLTAGSISFKDKELIGLSASDHLELRRSELAMIFQEPMSALNPSMRCGNQLRECLEMADFKGNIDDRMLELFEQVEIPQAKKALEAYPHQLSGGQKQRVMIAMALSKNPSLLIADEPTTALDVSVQKSILELLKKLKKEIGMSMVFISHDLGVVRDIADDVLVIFKGEKMEMASVNEIFTKPKSHYTKGLIACRPGPNTRYKKLPLISDFKYANPSDLSEWSADEKAKESAERQKKEPLLKISKLDKIYKSSTGLFSKEERKVHAINDLSLEIFEGETLGLVGESGCGKSTLGRILSGLERADLGQIEYRSKDISSLNAKEWRALHAEIQIVFQDPYSALNPRIKIGKAILEAMKIKRKKAKRGDVEELLERVGLDPLYYNRYPHEFSGGQRQRIGIARALALDPKFIICDESVSALDVSVQAQIINLLNSLKESFGFTYLFISHDMSVVKYISDRIAVMKAGEIVEKGLAEEVYFEPKDEYTKKLIDSIPKL